MAVQVEKYSLILRAGRPKPARRAGWRWAVSLLQQQRAAWAEMATTKTSKTTTTKTTTTTASSMPLCAIGGPAPGPRNNRRRSVFLQTETYMRYLRVLHLSIERTRYPLPLRHQTFTRGGLIGPCHTHQTSRNKSENSLDFSRISSPIPLLAKKSGTCQRAFSLASVGRKEATAAVGTGRTWAFRGGPGPSLIWEIGPDLPNP